MCRLFGAISNSQMDAACFLYEAPQSLLRQSRADRKQLQGDGWGIGWFRRGKPHVIKSELPIYRDASRLKRAGKRATGEVLIGHIRWASNPRKLKRRELIGMAHTQPFAHRQWLFAHNGTLFIPEEVKRELGPWRKFVRGNNDSEVLFYWLMKHRAQRSAANVRRALKGIEAVWKKCREKYPLYKHPFHGLNWVLTNGKVLIAMCYVNPVGFGKAKALCNHRKPYYQLHYKHDSSGWIVASEPLDLDPLWKPMRHGEVLTATAEGGTLWRLS